MCRDMGVWDLYFWDPKSMGCNGLFSEGGFARMRGNENGGGCELVTLRDTGMGGGRLQGEGWRVQEVVCMLLVIRHCGTPSALADRHQFDYFGPESKRFVQYLLRICAM